MATSLEALQNRSVALHGQATDEVLAVNRAILEIDPSHVAATNRLGIAYIARGDKDSALATFEAGVAANPHNEIAHRRLEGLQRPPLPPKPKRKAVARKA